MRPQNSMRRGMDVNAAGEDEGRRQETVRALGLPDRAHGSPLLEALCTALARQLELTHCLIGIAGRTGVDVVAASGVDIKTLDSRDPRASFFLWPLPAARTDMMVVQDVSHDGRFADKHWLRTTGAKFYVAVPLVSSNGAVIGFLVGINKTTAVRPAEEFHMLCNFAELAIRELESPSLAELQGLAEHEGKGLLRQPEESAQPVLLCEVTSRWWNIEFANSNACKIHSTMSAPGIPFWGVFQPETGAKNQAQKQAAAAIERGDDFVLHVKLRDHQGSQEPLTIRFRSARSTLISNPGTTVQVPHSVAVRDTAADVRHSHYFGLVQSPNAAAGEQAAGELHTLLHPQLSKGRGGGDGLSDVRLGLPIYSSNLIRVYRSFWHKEIVAVKVMAVRPEQCVRAADGFTLVPREADIILRLQHPNVIATYKVAVQRTLADCTTELYHKGEPVVVASYVREWCCHGDLQAHMDGGAFMEADRETPRLPLIIALAQDIAAGFQYLHSRHVVGANAHPKSILLAADPAPRDRELKPYVAKVSVLADAVEAEAPVHRDVPPPDSILFRYAAPELFSKGVVSKAGDVYAFGKLMWHVFTGGQGECKPASSRQSIDFGGRRSIDVGSRMSVDFGHHRKPAGGAEGFEALLKSCLAHKPQARPTFDSVVEALEVLSTGGLAEVPLRSAAAHRGPAVGSSPPTGASVWSHMAAHRASFDQARSVMNGLVTKTLQPRLNSRPLARNLSSEHEGSVHSVDSNRPPLAASRSRTLARKASNGSQDGEQQDARPRPAGERAGLASKLSGRLSGESAAAAAPEPQPAAKPRERLTSRLFGKKLKQVLQSPLGLGASS